MALQRKPLKDATRDELRDFIANVENLTLPEGREAEKMSVKEMREHLTSIGYTTIVVAEAQALSTRESEFDTDLYLLSQALEDIGLEDHDERWFKIRVDRAPNPKGRSKNPPVPVQYNDNLGWIPRGVVVWVRGQFVHCLNEAIETHTYQTDVSAKFAEATYKEDSLRYPFRVLGMGGLVKDGLPSQRRAGEQIIYNDRSAKDRRRRFDMAERNRLPSSQQRLAPPPM